MHGWGVRRAASLELRARFYLTLGGWAYSRLNAIIAQAEFMQANFDEASVSANVAFSRPE